MFQSKRILYLLEICWVLNLYWNLRFDVRLDDLQKCGETLLDNRNWMSNQKLVILEVSGLFGWHQVENENTSSALHVLF